MVAEKHIFLSVYNFFWIELNSDVAKGAPQNRQDGGSGVSDLL